MAPDPLGRALRNSRHYTNLAAAARQTFLGALTRRRIAGVPLELVTGSGADACFSSHPCGTVIPSTENA